MEKKITINNMHILLIIVGILFNSIGIFHSNLWFDESYSVALATHNWGEIWNIGGHDVHPVLYYWILSLINIIAGGNIVAYRIFSLICIALLSILGYTHIRKDFGEKTGILFSFFSLFLPEICIFSNEIRMYSLAILLVTILSIYGYRIYKGDTSWKNWIIFEITSLACIYTHYYGLMVAGLINLIMLFNFIKNHRKESTTRILVFGIIQVILYIPWIMYFVSQLKHVSKGFWIGFEFPGTLMELLSYQYIGNINYYVGFCISIILYIYLGVKIHKLRKIKEDILPIKLSIIIYLAIILAALILTALAQTSILYYRYLFVITGLYIFTLSFILSKEQNKKIIVAVCLITSILGISSNIIMIKDNYSSKNMKQIEYLNSNIQEGDYIVYTNVWEGAVITVNFPNNKQYYYNEPDWGVQEAYKAYAPQMDTYITKDFMNKLSGRIWIIDGDSDTCYKSLFDNDDYTYISQQSFETDYYDYHYVITLVEKK
ncbi:MAG: glycosyltransferase family 39 protein [Clostridia bacterium]|nr:glycosyltransferase family 39 protein [Clostridia bacterium]